MVMKSSSVNVDNIQGSIWPRLPKYYETFLFFKLKDTDAFKTQLRNFADKITTGAQCKEYLESINDLPQATPGKPRTDIPPNQRVPFEAVNISFSYKGIEKLVMQYKGNKLDDELHIRGQYKDLVFEGADQPERLAAEFKPGEKDSPNNDDWRVHGLFIITAQTERKLESKIEEVLEAFGIKKVEYKEREEPDEVKFDFSFGSFYIDTVSASIDIPFSPKMGNLRNADGKAEEAKDGKVSLHGKEHFGFEDEISQPQIRGLDPPESVNKEESRHVPPGWIFTGLEGDEAEQPEWATEGSFLVFRVIEQKVPEFNKFLKEQSKNMSSFDDGTGEKLGAHLMGRWKNGTPVELSPENDNPEHVFKNNFDFDNSRSRTKNVKCPFAAHIRKMRPRADLNIDRDDSDESDDEEVQINSQVINSNVIIRRSITFGPEVDKEEREKEETIKTRGIYFLCYQSSIRNGFNFLVTRWASNKVFPPNKGIEEGPGVDAFISQRNRPDHPEGYVSIFNKPEDENPYLVPLGFLPWIDQKGGEYFFTPSIKALKTTISEE